MWTELRASENTWAGKGFWSPVWMLQHGLGRSGISGTGYLVTAVSKHCSCQLCGHRPMAKIVVAMNSLLHLCASVRLNQHILTDLSTGCMLFAYYCKSYLNSMWHHSSSAGFYVGLGGEIHWHAEERSWMQCMEKEKYRIKNLCQALVQYLGALLTYSYSSFSGKKRRVVGSEKTPLNTLPGSH